MIKLCTKIGLFTTETTCNRESACQPSMTYLLSYILLLVALLHMCGTISQIGTCGFHTMDTYWKIKDINFNTWICKKAYFNWRNVKVYIIRRWLSCFVISQYPCKNLEMEDSCIVLSEALVWRNHSVQELLIHSQAGNGSQQPAVTCQQQTQIHEPCKHLIQIYLCIKLCSCDRLKPHCCISRSTAVQQ